MVPRAGDRRERVGLGRHPGLCSSPPFVLLPLPSLPRSLLLGGGHCHWPGSFGHQACVSFRTSILSRTGLRPMVLLVRVQGRQWEGFYPMWSSNPWSRVRPSCSWSDAGVAPHWSDVLVSCFISANFLGQLRVFKLVFEITG